MTGLEGAPTHTSGARTALIVLGMHRSGTSLVTRLVSLVGAELPSNLMPPHPSNPRGHWESEDLIRLHDQLLSEIGASWDCPLPLYLDRLRPESFSSYRASLLSVLHHNFLHSPLFVIKDPRICRLVPLWSEVLHAFDADARYIIVLRHPSEVAASLAERNRLGLEASMLLWMRYVLEAEQATRGLRRVFLLYADVLEDWRSAIQSVGHKLNVSWPRDIADAAAEVQAFIAPALRHHHANDDALLASLPWVRRVWSSVLKAASGSEQRATTVLDQISRKLTEADLLFAPIIAADRKELGRLLGELTRQQHEALRLSGDLALGNEEIARLREEVVRLQSKILEGNEEIARLHGEVVRTQSEILEGNEEIARLHGEVVRMQSQLIEGNEELAQMRGEAVAQSAVVLDLSKRLEGLYRSKSWRVTAPLRFLGTLARGRSSSADFLRKP